MKTFDFDQKVFRSFWKKFQQRYQNCILRIQVKIRGESFRKFITVFHFFWWAEKFELSMKTFPQSVKTVSYVWTATTREKICSSFISKCYFFWGFSQNFFREARQSCIIFVHSQPMSIWLIFDEKFVFINSSECGRKTIKPFEKKTWQESMLHVRRKLLVSHTFFFWKECFFLLEVWEFELKNINSLIKITGSPLKTVF